MAYTFAIDSSDDKFIFPEFDKTVFKNDEPRIDSNISHMFQKFHKRFHVIVLEKQKSK